MPLSIALGPGNEHDSRRFDELLESLDKAPKELYADSAYDTEAIRNKLSSMCIEPNIPVNPRNKRIRSAVERFYGWLKSLRRIIIRYERLAITYKAFITIACVIIHLRYGV